MKLFKTITVFITAVALTACSNNAEEQDNQSSVSDLSSGLTGNSPETILSTVPNGAQAVSLFGKPLSMPLPEQNLVDNLNEAKADYDSDPNNVDYLIWYGRKLAYAGDYRAAIRVYSQGIEMYPDEPRLYRHRCHRYLTTREFDRALFDCQKGASLIEGQEDSVEPDGAPNPANIPIYTRHSTIWYHLGLAYYFKRDWQKAHEAFQAGKNLHVNNDMEVSFSHWNYMALRRMGRDEDASASVADIPDDIVVYESEPYLKLLSLYKGEISVDELWKDNIEIEDNSAFKYGIANWYFYNGEYGKADSLMKSIALPTEVSGYGWAAFGFIAAEADLKDKLNNNK